MDKKKEQSALRGIFSTLMAPTPRGSGTAEMLPTFLRKKAIELGLISGHGDVYDPIKDAELKKYAKEPMTGMELATDALDVADVTKVGKALSLAGPIFTPLMTKMAKRYGTAADRWVKEGISVTHPNGWGMDQSRAARIADLRRRYISVLNATNPKHPDFNKIPLEDNIETREDLRNQIQELTQSGEIQVHNDPFSHVVSKQEDAAVDVTANAKEALKDVKNIKSGSLFEHFKRDGQKDWQQPVVTGEVGREKQLIKEAKENQKILNRQRTSQEQARQRMRKDIYGLHPSKENKTERDYMTNYAKKKAATESGFKNLFKSAKDYKPPIEAPTTQSSPAADNTGDIGAALAELKEQYEKRVRGQLRIYNVQQSNTAVDKLMRDELAKESDVHTYYEPFATPTKAQPSYMDEEIKDFIDSQEQFRTKKLQDVVDTLKASLEPKPKSSMQGAGTILSPSQRPGYSKWTKAKKGMNIKINPKGTK